MVIFFCRASEGESRASRPRRVRSVMLLASLRVAASKCCHALAMPAGGQEEAAGHEVIERIEDLPRVDHRDRVAGPRGIASRHSDPLRFAHSRDEERADTWYSSGTCALYIDFIPFDARSSERGRELWPRRISISWVGERIERESGENKKRCYY